MGVLSRRRDRLAKAVAAELTKANLASLLPAGTTSTLVNAQPAVPPADQYEAGGIPAIPMPRPARAFGSVLSPGVPLLPSPLDPVDPATGRAAPRRWEAPVSWNLDLTTRRTPWTVLRALADQCDIVHRCIEIRVAEITGLDWNFTLSDHAVSQIMADQGVGHAKAAQIGRDLFGAEIDRLKAFFEQPLGGYTFAEWLSEILWNHFVYDAVAVYPECTLAGQVTGLLVVDGATIKPLLDNRGMRPRPPAPAYQQILYGFPRGEYAESDPGMVDGEFYSDGSAGVRPSDQMAYMVRNRRTWDPYGFSTVEECIPAATLYLGRQRWLNAEYSDGATPQTWMKTDSDFGNDVVQLAAYERVLNDMLTGNTGERKRIKALPKGFEPHPMPQIDERYKPEYDEMIIKQIGSKFGVAPTQLGVIPRTGLGGRGQQEGEQDQAETMSRRPTEEWLIDVLNHFCWRFLGGQRQITVTFNGGGTAGDDLSDAKTSQVKIASGQTTLNDVRAKNGDPLFDMPEADEPMIVTDKGPVFLRGTLDAQMNPPVVPAPGPRPAPAPAPAPAPGGPLPAQEPGGDDDPDEMAKSAEIAAWRRYTAKGARSRPFTWHHHTAVEVDRITKAPQGFPGTQGGDHPKAPSRPGPGGHREPAIVDHYLPLVAQAVRLGINPRHLVDSYLAVHHPELAKDAIGSPADQAAIQAWLAELVLDPERLADLVRQIHADGYLSGLQTAVDQIEELGAAVVTSDLTDAATSIDWDTWTPGDPDIAALLDTLEGDGSGLAMLLARTDTTITGLTSTTLDRLGMILADGIANGDTPADIAAAIDLMLADPSRAEMIAVTETNRAMTLGTLDQYRTNGIPGFDWVNGSPCPLCAGYVEDNPHPLDDDTPPGHPRCRCAISPVLVMPDGSEVDDPESTDNLGE